MVHWVPLESNPEVFSQYAQKLGIDPKWNFTDVYGFDPDLLMMIPQPCLAFILLYKITETAEKIRADEEETLKEKPREENVFWMKQTIGNACGTIAIIHTLSNLSTECGLRPDGKLGAFLAGVEGSSPEEIGKRLEASEEIANLHQNISTSANNQTVAPDADKPLDDHFIALVHKNGSIYELDGRKNRPINHGPSCPDTFLMDAAEVCKKFIARDPSATHFAAMALADLS